MLKYDVAPFKHLSINIDVKTFNRIMATAKKRGLYNGDPSLKVNISYWPRLSEPNEFIRLKCHLFYMDFKMISYIEIKGMIEITFGELIDYNHASELNRKNNYKKKTK